MRVGHPIELCDCTPSSKSFVKDAVCDQSVAAIVVYALVVVLSVMTALVGVDAIVKFYKHPPASGRWRTMLLFVLFQVTLWSNALFALDIAFGYGRVVYFVFYFMTQIFYFSIFAYLY